MVIKEQELIIMVGPPASGKSTFAKNFLIPFNYIHVNRDTLQTQDKCLKVRYISKKFKIKMYETQRREEILFSYIN